MRVLFFILIFLAASASVMATRPSASVELRRYAGRIDGVIWDPERRPVADVYVELRTSMEGDLGRARTNGSGRFTFYNLSVGRFNLHVITTGTNLLEESQDVEIVGTALGNASETQYVEFHLKYDPRKLEVGSGGPAEAVFAQDVTDAARKLFKKGASNIHSAEGMKAVEDAILIDPDYFDALSAAGKEYVVRGDFAKGAVYLVRAVTVNPRSVSSYNSLAFAAYKLNKIPEATEAARLSFSLEPNAINSRILLGRLLRLGGKLSVAEGLLAETKKMAPNVALVRYELALVLNRENKNAEAADELTTYLKLAPDSPDRVEIESLIAKLKTSAQGTPQH